ncbi:3-keto-5-aminohexanoate cleavage protein [Methylobacterium currus]|uniref:3-keto-5-aminohexanoate cleavage protein n=1 Tax=Methylobacterium currus TaxID=2051553 RepID=UPI001E57A05D|nr:3-keto-5-aminohexanoate cleavage protein [Methylobacterium currus]UHC17869.1 3-keto-5-aminohexanoate cleavage protein [Methylobacterium currus]
MMEDLIITAAVNGGITNRFKHPNVPYSPEEIANSVVDCWNAGASIAHIHARNPDGTPCYTASIYGEIVQRIRDRCDIIINLSSSGLNLPKMEEASKAWNHLQFKPEIASFNCGSVNHGGKPFINHPETFRALAADMMKFGVRPEIEVYHEGVIEEAKLLAAEGILQGKLLFAFALGIRGGAAASCKNLLHFSECIPSNSAWSALAIGKSQLPINLHTILLGGHVRTGLEDNIYFTRGELAESSAHLVGRIVTLSRTVGREIASPTAARAMLSL